MSTYRFLLPMALTITAACSSSSNAGDSSAAAIVASDIHVAGALALDGTKVRVAYTGDPKYVGYSLTLPSAGRLVLHAHTITGSDPRIWLTDGAYKNLATSTENSSDDAVLNYTATAAGPMIAVVRSDSYKAATFDLWVESFGSGSSGGSGGKNPWGISPDKIGVPIVAMGHCADYWCTTAGGSEERSDGLPTVPHTVQLDITGGKLVATVSKIDLGTSGFSVRLPLQAALGDNVASGTGAGEQLEQIEFRNTSPLTIETTFQAKRSIDDYSCLGFWGNLECEVDIPRTDSP
jgi:hypothetical protein